MEVSEEQLLAEYAAFSFELFAYESFEVWVVERVRTWSAEHQCAVFAGFEDYRVPLATGTCRDSNSLDPAEV